MSNIVATNAAVMGCVVTRKILVSERARLFAKCDENKLLALPDV